MFQNNKKKHKNLRIQKGQLLMCVPACFSFAASETNVQVMTSPAHPCLQLQIQMLMTIQMLEIVLMTNMMKRVLLAVETMNSLVHLFSCLQTAE